MMQRELENKDGIIEKLNKELHKLNNKPKNHEITKNELVTLLTEKMEDLETKTRKIIKEEIKETENSKSPTTYAEMTKVHSCLLYTSDAADE